MRCFLPDSENDVFDASSNESFNLVEHHRLVAKVNKWLWAVQGQWPEPSSKTSDKNNCLHLKFLSLGTEYSVIR